FRRVLFRSGQIPRGGHAALVAVEHVHPGADLTVQRLDTHGELLVRPGGHALHLVALRPLPPVRVLDRHEHPVAGRLHDRRDRALPAHFALTGERQAPTLQPPHTDHRRVRAVSPHAGGVQIRAVRGVMTHGDDDSGTAGWGRIHAVRVGTDATILMEVGAWAGLSS